MPIGIAYDTTNKTLWIDNYSTSQLYDYALNGTLLTTYQLNPNNAYEGLAFDPADNTLWLYNSSGVPALEQYSRTGTLLSTFALPDEFDYNIVSAGFAVPAAAPVPIPGALLLFAPGLAGLAFVRRRFGK
jgi:sugar lactone lactonase YvrE